MANRGHKTGAIRKTPLMRVVDGENYILVASQGGAPKHPLWYHNLKADPDVEIRARTEVYPMCVREIFDANVANLHVTMAVPNCEFYEVFTYTGANKYGLVEDIEVDDKGLVYAPTSPGLGYDIDWNLIILELTVTAE